MTETKQPHILIIGAGFGGLEAARTLKNANVRITMIDKNNYHLFQPLLYQVATAALSPADIASPIRWILRKQKNLAVMLGEVLEIDPGRQLIRLQDQEISYDYLILAAGMTHSYFGKNDWAQFAPGLKLLSEATEIRRRILLARIFHDIAEQIPATRNFGRNNQACDFFSSKNSDSLPEHRCHKDKCANYSRISKQKDASDPQFIKIRHELVYFLCLKWLPVGTIRCKINPGQDRHWKIAFGCAGYSLK